MKEENGKPMIGRSATTLGVRIYIRDGVPHDVRPDANGNVAPGGGMSVSPALRYLPRHRVHERLGHIVDGANATDDRLRIWKMGTGPFVQEAVATNLMLRPDQPKQEAVKHGIVEPANEMLLETYEKALADTQDLWTIDETGD